MKKGFTKKKKFIFLSMAICCAFACAGIASYSTLSAQAERNVLLNYFKGQNYETQENYQDEKGREGTLFTPRAVGARLQTVDSIVGDFNAEFVFTDGEINNGAWQYKLFFTDVKDSQTFAVVFDGNGEEANVYVEYKGEKCGIYYENGQASFLTARKNALGEYMSVDLMQSVRVAFNPNSKEIRVNERLLWDFSKSVNDGRSIDSYIDGFSAYDVALEFTGNENGTGKVLVSSIFGCDLSSVEPKADVAPTLYADVRYHATVNRAWSIPKPTVNDLTDGAIEAENCRVVLLSSSGEKLLDANYTDGMTFTPTKEGEYCLVYNVTDADGNVATQSFDFVAYKAPQTTYILEKDLENSVYGVGTELCLPACKVDDELFRIDALRAAQGRIYKNSEIVQTFSADMEFNYTFAQAGEYTVEYYLDDSDDTISYEIVIRTDLPTLSFVKYEEFYQTGTTLRLQSATISVGTETKEAERLLISPNGKVVTGNAVSLTQAGKYTVRYTAVFAEKPVVFEKTFTVGLSVEDILVDVPGVSAQLSSHNADATLSGLKITSYPREDVTFASPIDFSAQNSGENFIELVAMQRTSGDMEYNEFKVILTDVTDSSNQLIITCYAHDNLKKTFVSVAAGADTPSLFKDGNLVKEAYKPLPGRFEFMTHETLGVTTWHSFGNTEECLREGASEIVLKLRLDYQNMKLYAYAGSDEPVEVADFNDENFIQEWGKKFTGFANGQAYCSVRYDHRKRNTLSWEDAVTPQVCCSYLVTKFGGYDYTTGKIEDVKAPEIKITEPDRISEAVVNKAYKIFEATATDNTCGFVPVNTFVVFNYGQPIETSIEIKNGAFTSKVVGKYTIVYEAKDAFGNLARVVKTVQSVLPKDLADIEVALEKNETEKLTGKKVYIADYNVNGGVGNYDVAITVKNGDIQAELYEDEKGWYFIPEKSGEYQITYRATDYVGNEGIVFYTENVGKFNTPIFSCDPIMPLALSAGVENILPIVEAIDYYAYPSVNLQVNVYVKYPKSASFELIENPVAFIPDAARVQTGDLLVIKYEAVGSSPSENVVSIEKEIPVANFNSTNGNIDYSEYFITKNATVYAEETSVYADCGAQESALIFGKKLLASGFAFTINIGQATVKEIEFYLADSEDGAQAVRVLFSANNGEYTYTVNGGKQTYEAECKNGEIIFRYDSAVKKVNLTSTNNAGTYVFEREDGEKFDGFTSGYVYMRMKVFADERLTMRLREIGNQTLFANGEDSGAPIILTEKDYGGSAYVGQEYEIPKAIAGDVLAFTGKITVTVRDGNGEYLTATDGTLLKGADASKTYYVILAKDGKHTIRYKCTDTNMIEAVTYNVNLYVSKPISKAEVSITLNDDVKSKAKVKDSYTLPTATPSSGAQVICVVYGPSYQVIKQTGGTVVFDQKGIYTIVYTVFDDIGNAKTYKYYVTVK